jgi:hypothetical protein
LESLPDFLNKVTGFYYIHKSDWSKAGKHTGDSKGTGFLGGVGKSSDNFDYNCD